MSLTDAQVVAQPLTFTRSGLTAPNRTLKSAMTERLGSWSDEPATNLENGKPTPEYLELYRRWGEGNIGVMIMGNIPCDVRYPEAKKNVVIDMAASWDHVAAFKPVIAAAKAHGSIVLAQLTHAGRQTSTAVTDHPVSSSDVQCPDAMGMSFGKPRALTIAEIEDVVQRFAFAAKVLYDAGADGINLHAAHGYLLSQFLSPRVNLRTDKYGGPIENRSRIIFEIMAAVRKLVPDERFMLSIKINSADFADKGFTAEECSDLVVKMEEAGMDLIELSGGTYESRGFMHKKESTIKREAFFIEFAEQIRPRLKTAKLCVTGGFRSTAAMASALRSHATDLVGMARPLTAEPDLPTHLISGKTLVAKDNKVDPAIQTGPAVMQLHDIATGVAIRDLSDAAVAEATVKAMMAARG